MANEAEVFQMLVEASKHNYETYLSTIWTITGSTMVALGWIFTSKNARYFLSKSSKTRLSLKTIIFILAGLSITILYYAANKSYQILGLIKETDFVITNKISEATYSLYHIYWYQPIVNIIIIVSLFFVLGKTIHDLRNYNEPDTEK